MSEFIVGPGGKAGKPIYVNPVWKTKPEEAAGKGKFERSGFSDQVASEPPGHRGRVGRDPIPIGNGSQGNPTTG